LRFGCSTWGGPDVVTDNDTAAANRGRLSAGTSYGVGRS
jgi:hypothetical protein